MVAWQQAKDAFICITLNENHIVQLPVLVGQCVKKNSVKWSWPYSPGVPLAQWFEHPTDVTKVVGSIPNWNSQIFSVVPSPVSKKASFTAVPYFPLNHKFVYNNFISDITHFLLWSILLISPRLSWVLSWFSLAKKKKMKSHSVSINAL